MKKMIAPIFITLIVCCIIITYIIGISSVLSFAKGSLVFIVIAICAFMLYLVVGLIISLIKRIKEIKEEDEDDLSKY